MIQLHTLLCEVQSELDNIANYEFNKLMTRLGSAESPEGSKSSLRCVVHASRLTCSTVWYTLPRF